jgi:hypothetical protein
MFAKNKGTHRAALAIIIFFVSLAIYGFAAANTVPESGAGDGSGTVSGYTISNIEYTLLSSDPSLLDEVDFDVAPTAGASAASDVRISVDGGTTWVTCTDSGGGSWNCAFTGGSEPGVAGITSLQVVAVD